MKKVNLIIIAFIVISLNARAQGKISKVIDEEYLNSIVVKEDGFSNVSLKTSNEPLLVTIKDNKGKKVVVKAPERSAVLVSKKSEVKNSEPFYYPVVIGNRANIDSQLLKRYNEDLKVIKVN
ncbi:MAG: hypothetical protein V4667_03505 [Bacteroidota bacterium]